jgi:hypothetical protein
LGDSPHLLPEMSDSHRRPTPRSRALAKRKCSTYRWVSVPFSLCQSIKSLAHLIRQNCSSQVRVYPATIGVVFGRRCIHPACTSLPQHTYKYSSVAKHRQDMPRRPRYYTPIMAGHTSL